MAKSQVNLTGKKVEEEQNQAVSQKQMQNGQGAEARPIISITKKNEDGSYQSVGGVWEMDKVAKNGAKMFSIKIEDKSYLGFENKK